MNDIVVRDDLSLVATGSQDFVTVMLDGQIVGIPVLAVHDVLNAQQITMIPRAQDWVAGVLNLRGRIVTAIDLRRRWACPHLKRENQACPSLSSITRSLIAFKSTRWARFCRWTTQISRKTR